MRTVIRQIAGVAWEDLPPRMRGHGHAEGGWMQKRHVRSARVTACAWDLLHRRNHGRFLCVCKQIRREQRAVADRKRCTTTRSLTTDVPNTY